jgi:hypothetical protein
MFYFYECGICDCLHPAKFEGDCRDDNNRFNADQLDQKYGPENWTAVPMSEADQWPRYAVEAMTKRHYQSR